VTAAVPDLDADKLSEESFQSFRAILHMALEVAKERRDALARDGSAVAAHLIGTAGALGRSLPGAPRFIWMLWNRLYTIQVRYSDPRRSIYAP
jgi:hypothetical protein